jgi:hypothetical protein
MHDRTGLSALTAVGLIAAGGLAAAEDAPATCEISAWTLGEDEVEVRRGPGADFPVIAKLPPPVEAEGDPYSTELSVTGSKQGWFRVEEAIVIDYIWDDPVETVFSGEGWVSGGDLGLALNHRYLYAGASTESRVVATLVDPVAGAGPDSFIVDRLYACQGDWVEVKGEFVGSRHRGWTTGTCSNQVTTCP